jgi:GT2 family glycosyltransferase
VDRDVVRWQTGTEGVRGAVELKRLTVCVVTFERAPFLVRCLESLGAATAEQVEVVVVDASRESAAEVAAQAYPGVRYVHAPGLAGWMTRSRNEALRWAHGDVISFLDDDVVVRPGWAEAVLAAFDDPYVAAVGGRTCNGIEGEESYSLPIGTLRSDGSLTDGFAAAATDIVPIDHGIGANMSFRREVLAALGGFRDDYPGTALREDTDIFLRVRAWGGRAVFAPQAVVDHRPAPHVRGARFDTRYKLYGRRNHMVLLARDQGLASPMLRKWVRGQFAAVRHAPGGLAARVKRLGVTVAGVVWGLLAAVRQAGWRPLPPARTGVTAEELRRRLAS